MKLSDRLGRTSDRTQVPPAPTHHETRSLPEPEPERSVDPLADVKERAQLTLFEVMGSSLTDLNLTDRAAKRRIDTVLDDILAAEEVLLSPAERREIVHSIADNLLGLGPIQALVDDPSVSEIMVNAPNAVFVERHGRLEETDVVFHSAAHIRSVIERIVTQVGRRIDESTPMVDARLADGSRVNAVLPPLTIDSPTLTIRKFADSRLDMDALVANTSLTPQVAEFLARCVQGKVNIVVSGGTGTGKTTMLNVLSACVPSAERIITIEDTAELQLQQHHLVRMESRPANIEGRGEIEIRDLVRNALRMRPDRIVVGEVRGAEALDMLQAMNTGHDGCLSTLHANGSRDAIARLETMVLMAGMDLPHRAIREQITSAVDLVVHLSRLADGSRRVVEVAEVTGMEGETIQLNPLFEFDWSAGRDGHGSFRGELHSTGIRPSFSERLTDAGLELRRELFAGLS